MSQEPQNLIALEQAHTHSPEETESFGAQIASRYGSRQVMALLGDLGAGKTALVRGIARALGTADPVASPTYAIVNEYRASRPICHFDMYRITNSDALYEIGWEDYLASGALCVVEWSENILDALPRGTLFIRMEKLGETDRCITVLQQEDSPC